MGCCGKGAAATSFIALTDTENTFGAPGTVATVNAAGDGLEFTTPSASGIVDAVPTDGSTNPVSSDGVFDALQTKLENALPDGQVLIGSAANVATPQSVSGDATIDNAGAVTVPALGTATGAGHMETYTGAIITDNQPQKVVNQELETAIEGIKTIYSDNDTLAGNRIVSGGTNDLRFVGVGTYQEAANIISSNATTENSVSGGTTVMVDATTELTLKGKTAVNVITPEVDATNATVGQVLTLIDAATGESEFQTPTSSTKSQYELTVGSSTIQIDGQAGVTAAIAGGEITLTIPLGVSYPDSVSFQVDNGDMTYTSAPFFPDAGFKITVDNSANSTVSIMPSTSINKTLLGSAIGETTNPSQPINPLDAKENVVTVSGGIFSLVYNDSAAIFPNGAIVRM